jgi:hypothetical protein
LGIPPFSGNPHISTISGWHLANGWMLCLEKLQEVRQGVDLEDYQWGYDGISMGFFSHKINHDWRL